MRISDWSSDVCSSDLSKAGGAVLHAVRHANRNRICRSKMAPAVLDEELDQQAQLFVGGRSDGGDHPNSRYAAHFRYSGIFPILIGAREGRYPTHPRFADVQ